MAVSIKLRLGNLFDGPSDLIVLPCSIDGSITGFVARSLSHYSIPHPSGRFRLGDVEILPFEGAENIAQYVAFAASVEGMRSSTNMIERIGNTLALFTKEKASVRSIAVPLLGAGAGGLRSEDVVAALRAGFVDAAADGATLIVHIRHAELFERMRNNRNVNASRPKEPVRVFISHTSADAAAADWVKDLALFLIGRGVQARLDRFHLRKGMDLPQWMCNELSMANKVIIICDEVFKQKADGRMGGVGWETMIIQGDIARLPPDSTKYQVVVRSKELDAGLPLYLRTKYVFHVPHIEEQSQFRDELVRELLDMPLDERLDATEFPM